MVIFTSDNGGQLDVGARNGPLRDGKQSVYEGGIKVTCGIRWPGTVTPGSETPLMALTMDIFPTILEAAGVDPPEDIDGVSFLPTLQGASQPELREHWFWRRREGGNAYGGKTIEAVRRGEWKLLQNSPFAPLELYNLKEDPLETQNVARQNPAVFNQLSAVLRKEIQRYGRIPWQAPMPKN
jgi:arylsulfatase A-like enzyme